jgi:hypothetical protein
MPLDSGDLPPTDESVPPDPFALPPVRTPPMPLDGGPPEDTPTENNPRTGVNILFSLWPAMFSGVVAFLSKKRE